MSEAPPKPGLKDALSDITHDLERAFNAGGGSMLVLPALRPLLGGLPEGCLVVSRGPWALQRSLLWTLLDTLPRRALGPVDARIDERSDASGDGAHSASTKLAGGTSGDDPPAVELTIHPRTLRFLVRYALARTARIDVDHLRHGNVEGLAWSRLAAATRTLSEHPVSVFDGPPAKIAVRWADGFVCWHLLLTDAPAPDSGDADIVIGLTLGGRGVELDVLDGRSEPPKRSFARLTDGVLHCGPDNPDEACAIDDGERRHEDAAAARAWKDDEEEEEDAGVTLWTPPPLDDER
jgi:hypothetical protein